ncbi:MAG: hypothetical protein P4L22_05235 [Candidatus Babeliales bacterium]|nr:hypothetical protein [Candidatus Babeliales bacterium]
MKNFIFLFLLASFSLYSSECLSPKLKPKALHKLKVEFNTKTSALEKLIIDNPNNSSLVTQAQFELGKLAYEYAKKNNDIYAYSYSYNSFKKSLNNLKNALELTEEEKILIEKMSQNSMEELERIIRHLNP